MVIKVYMGFCKHFAVFNLLTHNPKAMVLAGYFAQACFKVPNWVVKPSVPMVHFIGTYLAGPGQYLVAQANTKHGLIGI